MSIHEKIKKDSITALKKDMITLEDLRYILGEFSRLKGTKDGKEFVKGILTDEQAVRVLNKIIAAEQKLLKLVPGMHSSLISLIDFYLPKKISSNEITAFVVGNIDFSILRNKMQAVGIIKDHFGARVDSKMASKIIKEWEV